MGRPITYITKDGDTFQSVARMVTGSGTNADSIRASNPGTVEPFARGIALEVPSVNASGKKAFRASGLDIKVDGVNIDTFSSFALTMAVDGFRKAEFSTANEVQTRELLPQLNPLPIDIGIDGLQEMAGFLENPKTETTSTSKGLGIRVSSLPEVLLTPAPISAFPLEFLNADLSLIAGKLCELYSLKSFFDVPPGARFDKTALNQNQGCLPFLSNLAKQRSMVIGDDGFGSVVFTDGAAVGAPVLIIDDEGGRPDVSVKAIYNSAKYFSSVTGVLKSKKGRLREKLTIDNPHYRGIIKPHEFEIKESATGELETAVKAVAARMFAEVFRVEITIPGWKDRNGDTLKPGKIVKVRSPREYIKDFTELSIRTVSLTGEPNTRSASLSCTLPGVFGGIIPSVVSWN